MYDYPCYSMRQNFVRYARPNPPRRISVNTVMKTQSLHCSNDYYINCYLLFKLDVTGEKPCGS